MMKNKFKSFFYIGLLIGSFNLFGDTSDLPSNKTIENKNLVLNGVGFRKATVFKVKVYKGALYLEKKTSDAKVFLDDNTVKYIEMHFVRDVDKKSMVEGWMEAFNNALDKKLDPYKDKIDAFLSFNEDMKDQDTMFLTFSEMGVKTIIKGKEKAFIPGKDFARALLSVWFINAKDQGLRDGLLGL